MKADTDDATHAEKADEETNKKETAVMPPSVAWMEGPGYSGQSLYGKRNGQWTVLNVLLPHKTPVEAQDKA